MTPKGTRKAKPAAKTEWAPAPLLFLDTEGTGVGVDDEVWEVGAITRRRGEPDTDTERAYFVQHDLEKAKLLPESFRTDHDNRYDEHVAVMPSTAADWIRLVTHSGPDGGRVFLVGLNPAYDAGMLTRLMAEYDMEPGWHYHPIDVAAMAMGYLHAQSQALHASVEGEDDEVVARAEQLRQVATPPTSSDKLAAAVGVNPDDYDRHTALGDARFVRAIWDAITNSHRQGDADV